ncbi:HD domain-containing protein [Bacillus sp. NPDC094106]|uniref:HD domain-containing protein n=1 Tax=Bacillus sp. NPDC094106 TaxID=3363949 RepID=UPI0038061303
MQKIVKVEVPLYEDAVQICSEFGINPEKMYVCNNISNPFWYWDGIVFVSVFQISKQAFEMFEIDKRIKAKEDLVKKAYETKDFYKVFSFTEDFLKPYVLNEIYRDVPCEERYKLFREIYIYISYSHKVIKKEVIEEAIACQTEEFKKDLMVKLDSLSNNDFLTIYRGEGTFSISHESAMSWTTDIHVARKFAVKGTIYKGQVLKRKVIDFIEDRDESEILVYPNDVMNITEVTEQKGFDVMKELNLLEDEGYVDEFGTYRDTFVLDEYYHNPSSVHGPLHVKRVLLHTLSLSRTLKLSSVERAILANVAVFHDIGRTHDGHCTKHGEWSLEKHDELIAGRFPFVGINYVTPRTEGRMDYDIEFLTDESIEIIKFIIEYHCKDDKLAKKHLKKSKSISNENKEMAWNLYESFKDCDALDRVRLGDLDVSYLRKEESKDRVEFAYQLLNHIR